jgi:hypothetical protein
MNVAARLAGFAVILALVLGLSAFAGSRIDVRPGASADEPSEAMAGMAAEAGGDGHGSEAGEAPQPVRGLAVSDGGLTLELARTTAPQGRSVDLAFRIAGPDGRTVRDFDLEHTRRMHLIVVRRDMTGFQHLHPEQAADGTWSIPVTLRDAGAYRVFADFSVDGRPRTLAGDLIVDGAARSQALPRPVESVGVDGLRVTLANGAAAAGDESELAFRVTRDGKPVEVEEYLGAKGHLVALRRGDLAFLHVHPDESKLTFMATFPTAGDYRLFLQFKIDGRVHTAAFTQEVTR